MLKFGGTTEEGERLIGLVLSRENVKRMQDGQLIRVFGRDVGAGDVMIVIQAIDMTNQDLEAIANQVISDGGTLKDIADALASE